MFRKTLAVILAALMILSFSVFAFAGEKTDDSFGAYSHVYIIGIDGAGAEMKNCNTPNFDRIFENGAVIYDGHTEDITISAQNWGSILTGVACDKHGFTNSSIEENERDSTSANNSIFYYVRASKPDAQLVSVNNWSAINNGIIENDLGVEKVNCSSDEMIATAIQSWAEWGDGADLMFVQLDSVDHAGHSYGGQSAEYYAALEAVDVLLGNIYDALEENGKLEDALFIVVADHGEKDGGGHGGYTKEESSCVVAVAGKTVSNTTLPETTRNRDVAAIALYALGIEKPSHFTAVVPEGLFIPAAEDETTTTPVEDPTEKPADGDGTSNDNGGNFFTDFLAKLRDFFRKLLTMLGFKFD